MPASRTDAPRRGERVRFFLARAVRVPAVHYLICGGVLFLILSSHAATQESQPSAEREPIRINAAAIADLERAWADEHGAPPSPLERQGILDRAIGDEILYREARALGLHRDDRVVGERLVKLARFLALAPNGDEPALEAQARALDLDRDDPVIRLHLVQMMELAASRPLPSDIPTEEDLRAYYDNHAEELATPAQTLMTHVYLSRDRRGASIGSDAAQVRDALGRTGARREDAARYGDPFVRGSRIGPATDAELDGLFGAKFAEAISRLPGGEWAGPVESAYGLHLVWIHERLPSRPASRETVRSQLVHRLLRLKREERLASRMDALGRRYLATVH